MLRRSIHSFQSINNSSLMSVSSQDEYEMAMRVIQSFIFEYLEKKRRDGDDFDCLFTAVKRFPSSPSKKQFQLLSDDEGGEEEKVSEFYSKEEEKAVVIIQRVGRGYLGKILLRKIRIETKNRVEERRETIHQSALHLTESISHTMLSSQDEDGEEEGGSGGGDDVDMNSLLPS